MYNEIIMYWSDWWKFIRNNFNMWEVQYQGTDQLIATLVDWLQSFCDINISPFQELEITIQKITTYQALPFRKQRITTSNKFSRAGELLFVSSTKFLLKSRQTFVFWFWRCKSLEQNNQLLFQLSIIPSAVDL